MTDELVKRLLSLADCDARSGEPLGKCMREAAAELTRLTAALAEEQEAKRVLSTDLRDERAEREMLRESVACAGMSLVTAAIVMRKLGSEDNAKLFDRAAEAAEKVKDWSPAKQDFARRVTQPTPAPAKTGELGEPKKPFAETFSAETVIMDTFSPAHPSRDAVLEEERKIIADKAREYAGHYGPHSDGRNTFVLFAEWVEARALKSQPGEG
ncbi:MAG: hypothetical protein GEV06_16635 [Luteitalea sp.]|nr:hypothetical protein [Luteitalea sp.]